VAEHEVTCIIKPDPYSREERIEELQGPDFWGNPVWVAQRIKTHIDQFFVRNGPFKTYLRWRSGSNGDFVQTYGNNTWTDNLLELPQCQNRFIAP
jgi:hypothetical protein